jgi:hypothetical protein
MRTDDDGGLETAAGVQQSAVSCGRNSGPRSMGLGGVGWHKKQKGTAYVMRNEKQDAQEEKSELRIDKDSLILETIRDVMTGRGRYCGWESEDQKLIVHALMKM